jgi:hypothetical protein
LATGSQVLLQMSYSYHWTRYSNFFQMILESRIFMISNSSYSSISTGGGSTWNLSGIDDFLCNLSKETWNTRWIFIEGGNSRQNATSLIYLTTKKGSRQQKLSLSYGLLVLRLRWNNYTLSPMLIIGCAFWDLSALAFCRSWASRSLSFISV